ncbi:MAG: hydroxyacylglutathione hydrolase [Myxococcota bacterium]|nr:hydroxyacylglutathione hydrolase [Myxococcota bacterium]
MDPAMAHVVTQPTAPFLSRDATLEIHQVPSWQDNLIWLAVCTRTGEAAAIDGPEAESALAYCDARGLRLTTILNTHTHGDHVGINRDLERRGLLREMRVVGSASVASDVPGITEAVREGDSVRFGGATGLVMLTEGHLDGHISYVFEDVLFCGDTLFGGGCGYLFDGPPSKMHASLHRLAELPEETWVCCAHEYTQDNLRFAWSIEPENPWLAARIESVWTARARGESTVPSTIGEERRTNPFMRSDSRELQGYVAQAMPGVSLSTGTEVFAATRALKDRKDYKQMDEAALPLPPDTGRGSCP